MQVQLPWCEKLHFEWLISSLIWYIWPMPCGYIFIHQKFIFHQSVPLFLHAWFWILTCQSVIEKKGKSSRQILSGQQCDRVWNFCFPPVCLVLNHSRQLEGFHLWDQLVDNEITQQACECMPNVLIVYSKIINTYISNM